MRDPLYDDPLWYELIHAADASFEAAVLLRIARLHKVSGKNWLEPACGGGRIMKQLEHRGLSVTGYDSNPRMVAHARKRALSVEKGLMESWRGEPFDLAYSLHGTFRHLLSEKAALSHLRAIAASLRPGGLYIVGFDLTRYGTDSDDEELWEAREGRRQARMVVTNLPPARERRRERVLNFLWWREGSKEGTLQSQYDLRSYDLAQWKSLVRKSAFRLESVYSVNGKRIRLGRATTHGVFVLRR